MKSAGEIAKARNFGMMPQFTIVHHPIRRKFGLSQSHYSMIDSIDQLSNNPRYPYCTQKKEALADFLDIGRSTAFEAVKIGLELELLEKNPDGVGERATQKWIDAVRLYDEVRRR